MSKLAKHLKALLVEKGVSNADLASAMRIAEPALGQILAGDIERPSDQHLREAAGALGVSFDSLKDLVPSAMREAAEGSYEETQRQIMMALHSMRHSSGSRYLYPVAVFPDRVIVSDEKMLWQYSYEMGPDGVTLSDRKRVVETFRVTDDSMTEAEGAIVEADEGDGRWLIRVVRSGVSHNGFAYSNALLKESAARFDQAKCFVKGDVEHLRGGGVDPRNLIGRLSSPTYAEAHGRGEIRAVLELIEPQGDIGRKMLEAHRRDMADLIGFSIVARGRVRTGTVDGRAVRVAESITRVESVDLVAQPSAGGQLITIAESEDPDMKLKETMLKLIEAKLGKERLESLDQNDDTAVETAYREAVIAEAKESEAGAGSGGGGAGNDPAPASTEYVDQAIVGQAKLVEARGSAIDKVGASNLPEPAKKRLRSRYARATEAAICEAVDDDVKREREYLASVVPGGTVEGLGDATITEGRDEKITKMLDALFDPKDSSATSIKEAYIDLTGDRRVTGERRHANQALIREAIQTGAGGGAGILAQVFGDSIARRMVREYNESGIYDWWMDMFELMPISDFRTQRRIRFGGYGNLPTVAQGGDYAALTSPTDVEETYSVAKKGGTESITLEAIKNDDMQLVMRIPTRLGRAAKRTVSAFMAEFFTTGSGAGPTLEADTKTLFHADHNNSGTAALSSASVAAGRLAMLKQQEQDSSKQLGIMPRCLLVPWDLQETAEDLFIRGANQEDPDFVTRLRYKVVPVPEWTDANDWVLVADYRDCPTIELGFLDGMQDPELFLQSMETVGSFFDKDQWTWKIRHIYGGSVLDWRGFYKGLVT